MLPAPDVIPITEFRKSVARFIADAAHSGIPVYITQNGYVTAVLLAPEDYSSLVGTWEASSGDAARSYPRLPSRSPVLVETQYGLTDPETAAFIEESLRLEEARREQAERAQTEQVQAKTLGD
jgi:PHD/YefM family antitoxin component YafN of YafNO toxin-antitoxin module